MFQNNQSVMVGSSNKSVPEMAILNQIIIVEPKIIPESDILQFDFFLLLQLYWVNDHMISYVTNLNEDHVFL